MTKHEAAILNFIKRHVQEKGYSPSIRDISVGCGIKSHSSVHGTVGRMVQKGLLTRITGAHRSLHAVAQP